MTRRTAARRRSGGSAGRACRTGPHAAGGDPAAEAGAALHAMKALDKTPVGVLPRGCRRGGGD